MLRLMYWENMWKNYLNNNSMASIKGIHYKKINGKNVRIGIVHARWNNTITDQLLAGCLQSLTGAGVSKKNIFIIDVPGAWELPLGAIQLIKNKKVDVVVALACLLKGETLHFDYVSEATAHGLMHVMLDTNTPVIFGVLACQDEKQAIARSTGDNNHGFGWGLTALEMAAVRKTKR